MIYIPLYVQQNQDIRGQEQCQVIWYLDDITKLQYHAFTLVLFIHKETMKIINQQIQYMQLLYHAI